MISLNLYLFLAILELAFILLVGASILAYFVYKYHPYYMANTSPEIFLRKYIQYLIKASRKYGNSLKDEAGDGNVSANKHRQNMAARINWLILERDFSTTRTFNERYWEDLNTRIRNMLSRWEEVEFIREPPDISMINLTIDDSSLDEVDFNSSNIDEQAKQKISTLTKKVESLQKNESMFKEMEMAYKTLEINYDELSELVKSLKLSGDQVEILKGIVKRKEDNEKNLNEILSQAEDSKARLNEELSQLEDAYMKLEKQFSEEKDELESRISDTEISDDANDMVEILQHQEEVLNKLRNSFKQLNLNGKQQKEMEGHADTIEKNNKEISHCVQMIELERERLAEEVEHLQRNSAD